METYELTDDVKVLWIQVKSFPDGIIDAFKNLEKMLSPDHERPFYGISHFDETGKIVYKAAAPVKFPGEAEILGCETYLIRKGNYFAETVANFMKNPHKVGEAFDRLLANPEMDQTYPCVEFYKSPEEVLCMVRALKQEEISAS